MSLTGYPVCLVEIHGETETFQLSMDTAKPSSFSPSNDLLACTTSKRITMDGVGQFELHLTRAIDPQGRTWADKVRPQNLVVIQMMNHHGVNGPGGAGELHTVMIGLVDQITEVLTINQRGQPERRILVRGRDFTKIFQNGMITYWSFLGASLLGAGQYVDVARFNDTPARIVRELLETICVRFLRTSVIVDGVQTLLWDLLAYDLSSYEAELPAGLDAKFTMGEGSFWQFFVMIASPPFHELFIDTRRRQTTDTDEHATRETKAALHPLGRDTSSPTLVLRPTPFPYLTPPEFPQKFRGVQQLNDEGFLVVPDTVVHGLVDRPWDALIRHEIGHRDGLRGEPVSELLTVADAEHFNLYLPTPTYPFLPEKLFLLSAPPVFDRARFHRYGYRPLMPPCALIQPKQSGDTTEPMMDFYTRLAWRLASWNVLNDQFKSGTKTVQLSPHIHVGERLVDRSPWQAQVMEYYVEAVSHRFAFGEAATTTLGLTRGLPAEAYVRMSDLLKSQGLEMLDPTELTQNHLDMMSRSQKRQN